MLLWSSWRMYWRLRNRGWGRVACCHLLTKLSGHSAAKNVFKCVFFLFPDGIWSYIRTTISLYFISFKGKILIILSACYIMEKEIFEKVQTIFMSWYYTGWKKFHEFRKISHPPFSVTALELCGRNFGQLVRWKEEMEDGGWLEDEGILGGGGGIMQVWRGGIW